MTLWSPGNLAQCVMSGTIHAIHVPKTGKITLNQNHPILILENGISRLSQSKCVTKFSNQSEWQKGSNFK